MVDKMFEPGDVIIVKDVEELKKAIFKFYPDKMNENNNSYLQDVLAIANHRFVVEEVEDTQDFEDLQETWGITVEKSDDWTCYWRLLQDYFIPVNNPNNNVQLLFGSSVYQN